MKGHVGVVSFLILILLEVALSLSCHRAEYLIGQECCPMCPVGNRVNKHCTEFRSTSCLPCDSGTYMDEPTGRTQCLRCRICDSGSGLKVKAPCSSSSNTVCEPEAGYFCVGPIEEGSCGASQRHKICHPGHYIKQPGSASADTECAPCSEGTFSDGTLFDCQPHTLCEQNEVTVKAGTSDSDTECEERGPNYITIGISVAAVLAILLLSAAAGLIYRFCIKNKSGPREVQTHPEGQNLNPEQELRLVSST